MMLTPQFKAKEKENARFAEVSTRPRIAGIRAKVRVKEKESSAMEKVSGMIKVKEKVNGTTKESPKVNRKEMTKVRKVRARKAKVKVKTENRKAKVTRVNHQEKERV